MIDYELTLRPLEDEEPRRPHSRFTGTASPRIVAQQLRAVADELDPPRPVTRERSSFTQLIAGSERATLAPRPVRDDPQA